MWEKKTSTTYLPWDYSEHIVGSEDKYELPRSPPWNSTSDDPAFLLFPEVISPEKISFLY
jgi:hypothetical protein